MRPGPTTGRTRFAGLLGLPVEHSLSPRLHSAAHAARGLDAVYLALPVEPVDLPAAIAGLAALGAVGANVTVPHKQAVVAHCDEVTAEARLVGAVNTLVFDGPARVVGDNTDAEGLRAALGAEVGRLGGTRAVVLGAGGAARAAVVALLRSGAVPVVAARRPAAAQAVADELAGALGEHVGASGLDDPGLTDHVAAARVVVNATPLGLHDEALPGVVQGLGEGQVAYDLLYRATPWQRDSVDSGAAAHDGSRMLVEQAARSHATWFGGEPPVSVMLAALTG